jgi:hypothetical protein
MMNCDGRGWNRRVLISEFSRAIKETHPSQDCLSVDRDLNPGPFSYEAGTLHTPPQF